MAPNRIADVWRTVRNFFAPQRDQIRRIEQERFPGSYPQQYVYASRGKYYDYYQQYGQQVTHDLHQRFLDYEDMDDYPEVASAFDSYADDATQPQIWKGRKRIWVEGTNDNVVNDLNFVLHKQLGVNDFLWEQTRYLVKYGNNYERSFVNENGLVATEPLPAALTRRVHDQYGSLVGFLLSRTGDFSISPTQFRHLLQRNREEVAAGKTRTYYSFIHSTDVFAFEDWEVTHFRLVGKDRISEYGYSVAEPARWVFRRLIMMEDSALIHKLTRAPSRLVFYVETGNLPPRQALQHVQKVRDWYQRKRIVNPKTGKLDMSFNPLSIDEDIFIPMHRERGESVRVDSVMGPGYQPMDDVDYFRKKMGKALKIPNFGRDDDVQTRPLSQDDIRFASAVMRVQSAIKAGWKRMLSVHLVATGRSPSDTEWDVHMPMPSAILELARMEVLSAKSDILSRMQENISVRWMLTELFGFSEDEAVNLMVMRQEELDMMAVAEFEREMLRQKAFESEDVDEDRVLKEVQQKVWAKVRAGAYGMSPRTYEGGRDDMDAEKFIHELRSRDAELFDRLDMLREGLTVVSRKQDFA